MARGGRKTAVSRTIRVSLTPTPVSSTLTTPLSSAYPSTYASEAEWDANSELMVASMASLDLSNIPLVSSTKKAKPAKAKPFPFLELPSELRCKIYDYHFDNVDEVLDLDPANYKNIHNKLRILRVCRTIYAEASHQFYSTHAVRIFPCHPGRFFKTKKPLLARLNQRQRSCLTSLELRLGPGWNRPPRGWVVNEALGLKDCVNVRHLTVFVECDPSDGVFNGFRRGEGFYEGFSRGLLTEVLAEMPHLDRVYFDAWSSVKKSGAMMQGLFEVASSRGLKICWGRERGWTDQEEEPEVRILTLEDIMGMIGKDIPVMA
jgi:hypothetical protein